MKFKIGDRVMAIKPYDDNEIIVGKTGTVVGFTGVEIGVEFDEIVGGHSCYSNGKSGCCWWCSAETLEPIEDNKKIVITTDGVMTTAKLYDGKKVIKSAKAKCCPEDKFDFETGAKIAFDRLILAKGKTLHLSKSGSDDYGEVGKPTELKDINGEQLYVGDVVELFDKELSSHGKRFIANSSEHGDFVMGISFNSGTEYNHGKITGGLRIIKRKSYKDCKSGDIIGLLTVVENQGGKSNGTNKRTDN